MVESQEKERKGESLSGANSKDVFVDVDNYVSGYTDNEIDEGDRLNFAKRILLFLFIIVVLVFAASYISVAIFPENEKLDSIVNSILDITKTAVPSIVTLVLGFYFGRKE